MAYWDIPIRFITLYLLAKSRERTIGGKHQRNLDIILLLLGFINYCFDFNSMKGIVLPSYSSSKTNCQQIITL